MAKQLNMWSGRSFNITRDLKEACANVVSSSGMSRDEFLDAMNTLAAQYGVRLMKGNGQRLTKATFEKWLNPSCLEYVPPPVAIPIICEVGKSIEPLLVMAAPVGARVIEEGDATLLQWAKEYRKAAKARQAMKKLESEL